MFSIFLSLGLCLIHDNDLLITKQFVDKINRNPKSTYTARLNKQFQHLKIKNIKRFLKPINSNGAKALSDSLNVGSPRPVGANEEEFSHTNSHVMTGYTNNDNRYNITDGLRHVVYNNKDFCSTWQPAVTSAMSYALSIYHSKFINLSIQFILDCDIFGDPCFHRPPINQYEPFWKRKIPKVTRWDQPQPKNGTPTFLRSPPKALSTQICESNKGCFPGWETCPRNKVLAGQCHPFDFDSSCPVYFLYNWRWIKSHLWEVGPVTSTIVIRRSFFTYSEGIYSSSNENNEDDPILGLMDVTIIGWGQSKKEKWWYVIPHLGMDFGEKASVIFPTKEEQAFFGYRNKSATTTGIMRFALGSNEGKIESHAVGAVPFNFQPKPLRTPKPGNQKH